MSDANRSGDGAAFPTLTLAGLYESLCFRSPSDTIQRMSTFARGSFWALERSPDDPQTTHTLGPLPLDRLSPAMLDDCSFLLFNGAEVEVGTVRGALQPCVADYGHLPLAMGCRRMVDHGRGEAKFCLTVKTDSWLFKDSPDHRLELSRLRDGVKAARDKLESDAGISDIHDAVRAILPASCVMDLFVIGDALLTGSEYDGKFGEAIPATDNSTLFRTRSGSGEVGPFARALAPTGVTGEKQLAVHVAAEGLTIEELEATYLWPFKTRKNLLARIEAHHGAEP